MDVSFIVPTYKRPDALALTLDRLIDLDYRSAQYEVVVVDDGEHEATHDVVAARASAHPRLRYVAQSHTGVAKARNEGAKRAAGALLIFLDDDILVEPDHIQRHMAARELHGDCLVNGHWEFAPQLLEALRRTPFGRFRLSIEDWVKEGIEKELLPDGRLRPSGVTACNLSISAERFASLGGFDESFPFAGCEDQDFSYRAARAGCEFVYDPTIRLLHNDHRVTLDQFCARQQRGALTSVYLVARHPEGFADRPLLLENAPISKFDPWPLRIKKVLKRLYSTHTGLTVVGMATRVLERVAPHSGILRRLYEMTIGAHIFLGIREGIAKLPKAGSAARSASQRRYAHA